MNDDDDSPPLPGLEDPVDEEGVENNPSPVSGQSGASRASRRRNRRRNRRNRGSRNRRRHRFSGGKTSWSDNNARSFEPPNDDDEQESDASTVSSTLTKMTVTSYEFTLPSSDDNIAHATPPPSVAGKQGHNNLSNVGKSNRPSNGRNSPATNAGSGPAEGPARQSGGLSNGPTAGHLTDAQLTQLVNGLADRLGDRIADRVLETMSETLVQRLAHRLNDHINDADALLNRLTDRIVDRILNEGAAGALTRPAPPPATAVNASAQAEKQLPKLKVSQLPKAVPNAPSHMCSVTSSTSKQQKSQSNYKSVCCNVKAQISAAPQTSSGPSSFKLGPKAAKDASKSASVSGSSNKYSVPIKKQQHQPPKQINAATYKSSTSPNKSMLLKGSGQKSSESSWKSLKEPTPPNWRNKGSPLGKSLQKKEKSYGQPSKSSYGLASPVKKQQKH